jgi:hypothetical protein
MRDLHTGSATCNIDLRGDFGWTARLENGFAGSFGSIMKENKKKERNEKRTALSIFGIHFATLYLVHVALLCVIHPVGNLSYVESLRAFRRLSRKELVLVLTLLAPSSNP